MIFSSGHAMDKYRHGERPFALVTGSSAGLFQVSIIYYFIQTPIAGIGRGVALELAALKFNVIIHARTVEELEPVKAEINKRHPDVTVVCIAQDASLKVDWPQFMKQIADLNITVLVNNVGTSIPLNTLETATDEQIEGVMRINTIFPTQLTRNLLPSLIKNSPSLILTMCSASCYAPIAFLGVYCGTKASNLAWSESLYNELRLMKRDVDCKAVMTGEVSSYGYNIPVSAFAPAADDYAKSLLSRAGSSGPVYNGYWRHTIQVSPSPYLRPF